MNTFFICYFGLLAISVLLSYLSYIKGNNNLIFILLVLVATFLIETSTQLIYQYKVEGYNFIYHIFNYAEYTLFSIYYLKACSNNKFKFLVKLSIPFFVLISLYISIFIYHFENLPVLNLDIEGFLLFIIYTHLLFSLDTDKNKFIYTHPDFWIATGLLIFFGGVFMFWGLYPVLIHIDPIKALQEYSFVIRPLNIIFYICIIIGLICSIRNKKYLIQ